MCEIASFEYVLILFQIEIKKCTKNYLFLCELRNIHLVNGITGLFYFMKKPKAAVNSP